MEVEGKMVGDTLLNQASAVQTAKPNFLPLVQIFRALAAISVVFTHVPGSFIHAGFNGIKEIWYFQAGVDIFFVISGFVMHYMEDGRGINEALHFLKRRINRILPLYWFFLTIALSIYLHTHRHVPIRLSEIRTIVFSYLFWPHANVPSEKWNFIPIYPVGWTLNLEMYFYFLCFSNMIFLQKKLRIYAISLIITSIITINCIWDIPLPFYVWGDPITLEFVFGMFVASNLDRIKLVRTNIKILIGITSICIFVASTYFHEQLVSTLGEFSVLWRPISWGIPSVGLLIIAVSWSSSKKSKIIDVLLFAGAASYSIYLTHPLILDYLANVFMIENIQISSEVVYVVSEVTMLVCAILAGIFVYILVERPLSKLVRQMTTLVGLRAIRSAAKALWAFGT